MVWFVMLTWRATYEQHTRLAAVQDHLTNIMSIHPPADVA